jgi:hypothetical protein
MNSSHAAMRAVTLCLLTVALLKRKLHWLSKTPIATVNV